MLNIENFQKVDGRYEIPRGTQLHSFLLLENIIKEDIETFHVSPLNLKHYIDMYNEESPVTPEEVMAQCKVTNADVKELNQKIKSLFHETSAIVESKFPFKVQLKPLYEDKGWIVKVISPTVWVFSVQ